MSDQVTAAFSGQAKKFESPQSFKDGAYIKSFDEYQKMYKRSIEDPESFWKEQANRIDWYKPFDKVKDVSYASKNLHIKWYEGGKLNASYNCLDRHLKSFGDKTALIFEADDPNVPAEHITYRDMYERVCRFANAMKARGVKKGDRVTIYLPMIPEAAVAMLACARIGAPHSVVFAGFSPDSLAETSKRSCTTG